MPSAEDILDRVKSTLILTGKSRGSFAQEIMKLRKPFKQFTQGDRVQVSRWLSGTIKPQHEILLCMEEWLKENEITK